LQGEENFWKMAAKVAIFAVAFFPAFAIDIVCSLASKFYQPRREAIADLRWNNTIQLIGRFGVEPSVIIGDFLREGVDREASQFDSEIISSLRKSLPGAKARRANLNELVARVGRDPALIVLESLGSDESSSLFSPDAFQKVVSFIKPQVEASGKMTWLQWKEFERLNELSSICDKQKAVLQKERIIHLDLSRSEIDDLQFEQLLAQLSALQYLNLMDCEKLSQTALKKGVEKLGKQLKGISLGHWWQKLTLSNEVVEAMITHSASSLESLTLRQCVIDEGKYRQLIQRCTQLRSFSSRSTPLSPEILIDLSNCPLERVEFEFLIAFHHDGLRAIFQRCPIKHLKCINVNFSGEEFRRLIKRRGNEILSWIYCSPLQSMMGVGCEFRDQEVDALAGHCPNLQTAVLDLRNVSKRAVHSLVAECARLETIGLFVNQPYHEKQTREIGIEALEFRPCLKRLFVGAGIDVTADQLRIVIKRCPSIQTIWASHLPEEIFSVLRREFPAVEFVQWNGSLRGLPDFG